MLSPLTHQRTHPPTHGTATPITRFPYYPHAKFVFLLWLVLPKCRVRSSRAVAVTAGMMHVWAVLVLRRTRSVTPQVTRCRPLPSMTQLSTNLSPPPFTLPPSPYLASPRSPSPSSSVSVTPSLLHPLLSLPPSRCSSHAAAAAVTPLPPLFQGAVHVYLRLMYPLLARFGPKVDVCANRVRAALVRAGGLGPLDHGNPLSQHPCI